LKALLYYLFTTITGIGIALTLANIIKPGSKVSYNNNTTTYKNESGLPQVDKKILIINTIFDLVR
jgi:Na+/H+-dicarboxylate symporter